MIGTASAWFGSLVGDDGGRLVGLLGGASFGVVAAAFPNGPPASVSLAVVLAAAPVCAAFSAFPYIRLADPPLLMGAAAMTSGAGTLALLASGALAAHRRRQQMEIDLAKSLTV